MRDHLKNDNTIILKASHDIDYIAEQLSTKKNSFFHVEIEQKSDSILGKAKEETKKINPAYERLVKNLDKKRRIPLLNMILRWFGNAEN